MIWQACEPPPAEDERDIWIVERGKLKRPTDQDDKNPADPEQDKENQS